jgi:hypothetical protein
MPGTSLFSFRRMALSAMLAFTVFACVCEGLAEGLAKDQVKHVNGFTVLNTQTAQARVDFVRAKPMPLPINDSPQDPTQAMIQALASPPTLGKSGYSPGAEGSGKMSPVFLGKPAVAEAESGVTPEDFGTNNHPFTTARADLFGLNDNAVYPYRAAGKLFFNIGSSSLYVLRL